MDEQYEDDPMVCSATECTGLIPSLPENEEEKENYKDIVHYAPKKDKYTRNDRHES